MAIVTVLAEATTRARKAKPLNLTLKLLIRRRCQEDKGKKDPDQKGNNGIATVDDKYQVVVDAEVFGEGHEAKNLGKVVESIEQTRDSGSGIRALPANGNTKKTTDRKGTSTARKYFSAADFQFDSRGALIWPAGTPMKSSCPNWRDKKKGYTGKTFIGSEKYCSVCKLQEKCLRSPAAKVSRCFPISGTRWEWIILSCVVERK